MYVLAHTGIGGFLAKPFSRGLPKKYLYIGALLPDIIDKASFYTLRAIDSNSWIYTDVIRGTRSFGHTLVFLLLCFIASAGMKSRRMLLLTFGVATHLLLDQIDETFVARSASGAYQAYSTVLFWPFQGIGFPKYPFGGVEDHLSKMIDPVHLATEIIGGLLLVWEYRRFLRIRIKGEEK